MVLSVPNRILREGILTSERVNALSWPAEVFYRRLISVVDDFGRYYAKPDLLRAACYPLKLDTVGNPDVVKWLAECARAGLVRTYAVDGKDYLQIEDFRQQARAKRSKFPQQPSTCVADAMQVPSTCDPSAHVYECVFEDEGAARGRGSRELPGDWNPKPETSERLSREFGLRVPEDVERYVAAFKDICAAKGYRYKNFDAAFSNCVRQDWPKLRAGGQLRTANSNKFHI